MCKIFSGKFGGIRVKIFRNSKNVLAPTPTCCTTTDLGIFGTVLGIFGVAFVRAVIDTSKPACDDW